MCNATVWKYDIPFDAEFGLRMPKGARPLHVDLQGQLPRLWALIPDTEAETEIRLFIHAGTGHKLPNYRLHFIGTYFTGGLVFHVFERVSDV